MATLIFDASVIVKLFVAEPGSSEARTLFGSDATILVPAHAFAELGEILARKIINGSAARDQLDGMMETLREGFVTIPLEHILEDALRLAIEAGASVYDTLYVALAAAENCPLVTADRRLVEKLSNTPYAGLLSLLDSSIGSR